MVDYSKWDHFEVSDSDDSDADEMSRTPHVTRLDQGTRVTFGQQGVSFTTPAAPNTATTAPAAATTTAPAETEEAVVARRRSELTRNGGAEATHLWSQTRDEVRIAVFVPAGTRARDVRVDLVARPQPHVAVAVHGARVLDAAVAHPFADDDDALDACYELRDYDAAHRVCVVELRKPRVVGAGDSAVLWWDRALACDTPRDAAAFPDADHTPAGVARQQQWAAAWAEAHRLFREKVRAQQPVIIGGDDDDDDGDDDSSTTKCREKQQQQQ